MAERVIEFLDGNTGAVVARVPFDQVPPPNREVYLRQGLEVSRIEDSDEVVPIARVVKLAVDENGRPVPRERARKLLIREYDEGGTLLRESLMLVP